MKMVGLKTLGSVVAMVVACNVYAQTNATDTASAAAAVKAGKHANHELGRKVRAALTKVQGLDVSHIAVRARGGAVTLTGSVPTEGQIGLAGDAAKGVEGVTSVTNKLSVVQQ
ncbi:BON domain-containing protein [Paraburkholderia sp. MMS20-SJTN17]|uniref:BON domain-containing protein n=1 Tax=Paraburkholderia translucens TaxID=2886945 RepID=A0ABS8K975_9BURK|nr:BON domain-containing protein [Paraburkholderia sp. MMS20-SJTN17]MCC8401274.1 BON domain-containing protein [Paraburkholderia sp. MMS20-SJTN17]